MLHDLQTSCTNYKDNEMYKCIKFCVLISYCVRDIAFSNILDLIKDNF